MDKAQSKQQQKQDRRRKYGWFLWIVALIFIQGVYGTELTKEEKDAMQGLYLSVSSHYVTALTTSINTENQLLLGSMFEKYELKKYEDSETLNQFATINGAYYFKHFRDNKLLVVTTDGILYIYNTVKKSMHEVLYKINVNEDDKISDRQNELESKISGPEPKMIRDPFESRKFEEVKELAEKLIHPLTRGSVLLPPKPTEALTVTTDDNQKKQSDDKPIKITTNKNQNKHSNDDHFEFNVVNLSIGVIALIAFVTVLCLLCCDDLNQANVHLESNDPRNQYPSPTDLVINIRTTETIESTDTNTNSNSTASTVSLEKLESNSSSLLTFKSTDSETSLNDQINANDSNTTDDFSI